MWAGFQDHQRFIANSLNCRLEAFFQGTWAADFT